MPPSFQVPCEASAKPGDALNESKIKKKKILFTLGISLKSAARDDFDLEARGKI